MRRSGSGAASFRKDIDLDISILVPDFGPAAAHRGQQLKAGNRGGLQKIVNPARRQNDVNILRHAAQEAVKPDRPAARQQRFALCYLEAMVDRLDDTAISARKILGLDHFAPPG